VKGSLTESPRLLKEDRRNITEDGLGASHRIKFLQEILIRLRRVRPLS